MTFDQYMCGLMILNMENEKDVDFLFRQLLLLRSTEKGISIKILIQHVINLKLTQPGLIK